MSGSGKLFDLTALVGSLFTQAPHWLRSGFGGQDPEVPNHFAPLVVPVVDVATPTGFQRQSGFLYLGTHAALSVVSGVELLTNTSTEAALLIGIRITITGGAGGTGALGIRYATGGGSGLNITVRNFNRAAGQDLSHEDVLGTSDRRLYIPPEGKLLYTLGTMGAAESANVSAAYLKFPAGVRPW